MDETTTRTREAIEADLESVQLEIDNERYDLDEHEQLVEYHRRNIAILLMQRERLEAERERCSVMIDRADRV
jgi:hypothetical protein